MRKLLLTILVCLALLPDGAQAIPVSPTVYNKAEAKEEPFEIISWTSGIILLMTVPAIGALVFARVKY